MNLSASTLCLIDGKNLCYRAHWVHRFLSSRGRPTSVLYGALKMLAAVGNQFSDTAFVFVWDGAGKTWRHELSSEYKGSRINHEEVHDEMSACFPQIPILRKVLDRAGFRQFCFDALECDDLIGILTKAAVDRDLFDRVIIYSTDKDFYQLVGPRVMVLRRRSKADDEDSLVDAAAVHSELGVSPRDWIKVKALAGDSSDNITNVQRGLGPKTAIKMIQAGLDPSREAFHKHPFAVQQQMMFISQLWPKVKLNYELATIVQDPNHRRIPAVIRTPLVNMVENLNQSSFLRRKELTSDDAYQEFTSFLAEYEMADLLTHRRLLWRLP